MAPLIVGAADLQRQRFEAREKTRARGSRPQASAASAGAEPGKAVAATTAPTWRRTSRRVTRLSGIWLSALRRFYPIQVTP